MDDPTDFVVLRWSVMDAQVCTSLDEDEATKRLNEELPTGISSDWAPVHNEGEHRDPVACEKFPETHRHILFTC